MKLRVDHGFRRTGVALCSHGKGWFMILRLYTPLEPLFTKEWRPSEIELVR
jgi:hypothetical protein